ncbi:MAG: ABC transporter permease [Conexivisphaerales archaeon]
MQLPIEPRKVWALAKRDFYDWSSYKNQMITTVLASAVGLASWGFNASYRDAPVPQYNTDFVSFLIVGILVGNIIMSLGSGLDRRIKPWTLETLLMTGIRTPTFVLGTVAWTYILAAILFIPQLVIAIYVFDAHFDVNFLSLSLAIIISSSIIFSLSMIATGLRLVTKVTDPVTWGLTIAQQLLSGMTFPVSHLDNYLPGLSYVSWVLPQTWIYHIIRLASLTDASIFVPGVALSFIASAFIAAILLPFSLYIFRWGMKRAKKDGTLGWY